jgi:hypothetical protein
MKLWTDFEINWTLSDVEKFGGMAANTLHDIKSGFLHPPPDVT